MSKNYYKMTIEQKQEWTKQYINNILTKENMDIIPVEFSNKMTRTLGMFRFYNYPRKPKEFKISNNMLKNATLKSIKDVLNHEIAHYLTEFKYSKITNNGHNEYFKMVCNKLFSLDGKMTATGYREIKNKK